MPWATPTDYRHAIQDPPAALDDEELRQGQVSRNAQGLPMLWSGNFASVFRIYCPATDKTWALKCFTREAGTRQERYQHIAAGLAAARLPFTVPFAYLERGIQIHGEWYPAVKMEWVEGQTLNRFVEDSLEKPKMLRQLLELWPKLAARLRDAEIAHADLQHGNVLLVPTPDGKLALKLIDYDGMYVPALAGTRSGEAGHPNYQHPRRLREGSYNVHVDRFSHLAIFSAVHCLCDGNVDLWTRFNNDENLLFREQDFQAPEQSELFGTLWESSDPSVRGLVGRLALACRQPLDEVPWLDEVVVNGRVQELSRNEEDRVAEMLAVGKATVSLTHPLVAGDGRSAGDGTGSMAQSPTLPLPLETPGPVTTDTRPIVAEGTLPDPPRPGSDFRATGKSLLGRLAAATGGLGRLLLRLVGVENTLLRYSLWGVLALLLSAAVWFTASTLRRPFSATHTPLVAPTAELRLRPIDPQTIEAGQPLRVEVKLENAEVWAGKVHYGLSSPSPPGMGIDIGTGILTWTPPQDEAADKHEVTVLATGPDGRTVETSLVVDVLRPVPPLKFNPIPAPTVAAGKPLRLAVTLENADAWRGKVRYAIASPALPGATIDAQSGQFSWTPPQGQAAGQKEVSVSAAGPEGQITQTRFTITVTRSVRSVPEVFPVEQLRATAGRGALAEVDEGGKRETRGKRWVVVTGLVPYKKQLAEYHAKFDGVAGHDPGKDVPNYAGYFIERAEVVPGEKEPQWSRPTIFVNKFATDAIARIGGRLAEEIADPRLVRPNLASPLFLVADATWGNEAVSPPQIPLVEHEPNAGEYFPPDYNLLRYFDFDVEPNKQYQYRVFLALQNPNYHLAAGLLEDPENANKPFIGVGSDGPDPKLARWSDVCTSNRLPGDLRLLGGKVVAAKAPQELSAEVRILKWMEKNGRDGSFKKENLVGGTILKFPDAAIKIPGAYNVSQPLDTRCLLVDVQGGEPPVPRDRTCFSPGLILVMDEAGNLVMYDEVAEAKQWEEAIKEPQPKQPEKGRGRPRPPEAALPPEAIGPPEAVAPPEAIGPPEDVDLTTDDGLMMKATYFPGTKGQESIPVILLHGFNKGKAKHSRKDFTQEQGLAWFLQAKLGCAVIAPDLRGHGGSTAIEVRKRLTKVEITDDRRLRPADISLMVTQDLGAVKDFLWKKNNQRKLNIDKLVVIGVEEGAALALFYTAYDAVGYEQGQTMYGAMKVGHFVKAAVLISPPPSPIPALKTLQVMQMPMICRDLPVMIAMGNKSKEHSTEAATLYRLFAKSRPPAHGVNSESATVWFLNKIDTHLQGSNLLAEVSLQVPDKIVAFLTARLVKNPAATEYVWKERKLPRE